MRLSLAQAYEVLWTLGARMSAGFTALSVGSAFCTYRQLALGAIAYLNIITSTHIRFLVDVTPLAAVSAYGLQEIDWAMQRHLFREALTITSATTSTGR